MGENRGPLNSSYCGRIKIRFATLRPVTSRVPAPLPSVLHLSAKYPDILYSMFLSASLFLPAPDQVCVRFYIIFYLHPFILF